MVHPVNELMENYKPGHGVRSGAPMVSCIISTYNAAENIGGCLDALLGQTICSQMELIVVDSGSEENEKDIVFRYRQNHSNIIYIRTAERETVYKAWNRGLHIARGKYITNANTDDRLAPWALERMVQELEANPSVGLVYADVFVTSETNQDWDSFVHSGYIKRPDFHPEIMNTGCHMGPQPMWRKKLHETAGEFDESYIVAGDFDMWSRFARFAQFRHIPEFLGVYHNNPSGVENRHGDTVVTEAMRILNRNRQCFPSPAKGKNIVNNYYFDQRDRPLFSKSGWPPEADIGTLRDWERNRRWHELYQVMVALRKDHPNYLDLMVHECIYALRSGDLDGFAQAYADLACAAGPGYRPLGQFKSALQQIPRKIFPESKLAHRLLDGKKGLEIGASSHNPFGLHTINAGHWDPIYIAEQIKLTGSFASIEIEADADQIPLPTESQDFVITSHVLEHCPDVIKTLLEWYRLAKPGGHIFMIIPLRDSAPTDRGKPITDWRHIQEDFIKRNTASDEPATGLFGHCHYHVFSLQNTIGWIDKIFGDRVKIVAQQERDDKNRLGFTIVLQKMSSCADSSGWDIGGVPVNGLERFSSPSRLKCRQPYVNIGLISEDRPDSIKATIESLLENTRYPYKLTVVDNGGSNDEVRAWLQTQKKKGVISNLIVHEKKIGMGKALNLGWKAEPRAKYFLRIRDGIVIRKKDWLMELVAAAEKIPEIGMVAYSLESATNYPARKINGHVVQLLPRHDFIQGNCVLIPNRTSDPIGYLNEQHERCEDVDRDYCRRVSSAGMLNAYLGGNDGAGVIAAVQTPENIAGKRSTRGLDAPPKSPVIRKNAAYANICMVTYNRIEFTRRAIASIVQHTRYPYVLTVIDNDSQDGTKAFLTRLRKKGVIANLVLMDENVGVAKAANIGWLLEPEAEYYVKYDNDIVIQTTQWLSDLIHVVDRVPNAGAVAYNFEAYSYPVQTLDGLRIRPKHRGNLGGACICIPKRTRDRLGYWREDYGLYSEEDADYGCRIKVAGLLNVYMENENIGLHLPAGRAALIDSNMTARDGLEEKIHAEYRAFKDEQRRKNVLTNKFAHNVRNYQTGAASLYQDAAYARAWLRSGGSPSFVRSQPGTRDGSGHPITKPLRMSLHPGSKRSAAMKIAVFSYDSQDTACSHLRIVGPLRFFQNHSVNWCVRVDGQKAAIDLDPLRTADLVVVQRGFPSALSQPFIDHIHAAGKPIIYELDDFLLDLPATNPHHQAVEKQKRHLLDMIRRATAITVATEQLKQQLSTYHSNIYVLPNLIDEKAWQHPRKADALPLVIGYVGTATHRADLQIVEKALVDIMNRYGNKVHLVTFGCTAESLLRLPNHQAVPFHLRYADYIRQLQALNIDIALAPLENNAFNQCKSNIKWLEYSAAGIAGIYSNVLPYNQDIQHGQTGLLVENDTLSWYNAIRTLIEEPQTRTGIAEKACRRIVSDYTMNSNAHQWTATYRRILDRYKGIHSHTGHCAFAN